MSKIFQLSESPPTVEDILDLLSETLPGRPVRGDRYIIEVHDTDNDDVIVDLDDGTSFVVQVKQT